VKLTLKACRTNVKATAREEAEYVGVSEDSVYNWESGKYCPSAIHAQKLLKFFEEKGFSISLDNINFLP
jgi:DNA-binding XRE family transcriptional regulator